MPGAKLPVLYSFRRCPYAIRARMAMRAAGIICELREILLRDKAPEFLAASPKGTVPVLILPDGTVLEQSLEIMHWALGRCDPRGLLPSAEQRSMTAELIARAESEFKPQLDAYKYASRIPDSDPLLARALAGDFLNSLEDILADHACMGGPERTLADLAIAPFVRQFANVDRKWFDAQNWPRLRRWLDDFLRSDEFVSVMIKYPKWVAGDAVTRFPANAVS